jgi:hypothetical protein
VVFGIKIFGTSFPGFLSFFPPAGFLQDSACRSFAKLMQYFLARLYGVILQEFFCTAKRCKNNTHAGRADVECSKGGLKEDPVFCEFSR